MPSDPFGQLRIPSHTFGRLLIPSDTFGLLRNGSAYPDYGIYTYANGDRYGGSWKQGKKHGIGTYYFVSGAK